MSPLFNIVLEVLSRRIRQEEQETNIIQTGQEDVKLPLFSGNTVLYGDNHKVSTKSIMSLYTNNNKMVPKQEDNFIYSSIKKNKDRNKFKQGSESYTMKFIKP